MRRCQHFGRPTIRVGFDDARTLSPADHRHQPRHGQRGDGLRTAGLKSKLEELEHRKGELQAVVETTTPPAPGCTLTSPISMVCLAALFVSSSRRQILPSWRYMPDS